MSFDLEYKLNEGNLGAAYQDSVRLAGELDGILWTFRPLEGRQFGWAGLKANLCAQCMRFQDDAFHHSLHNVWKASWALAAVSQAAPVGLFRSTSTAEGLWELLLDLIFRLESDAGFQDLVSLVTATMPADLPWASGLVPCLETCIDENSKRLADGLAREEDDRGTVLARIDAWRSVGARLKASDDFHKAVLAIDRDKTFACLDSAFEGWNYTRVSVDLKTEFAQAALARAAHGLAQNSHDDSAVFTEPQRLPLTSRIDFMCTVLEKVRQRKPLLECGNEGVQRGQCDTTASPVSKKDLENLQLAAKPRANSGELCGTPTREFCLVPPNRIRWEAAIEVEPRFYHLLSAALDAGDQGVSYHEIQRAIHFGRNVSERTIANEIRGLDRHLRDIGFPWGVKTKGGYMVRTSIS